MKIVSWWTQASNSPIRLLSSLFPYLLFLLIISSDTVFACSVCYGNAEGDIIDALNFSIIFMLGITYLILGTFVFLFVKLRKRERLFSPTSQDLGQDQDDGRTSTVY